MSAFNLKTHFGAYLFRENHFNSNGIVGFMELEVLDGYVDASGNDSNAKDKVLVVSGCLSTPLKWQEFDNEWQTYLKSEGFPLDAGTGRYVSHTTDLWSEKKRSNRNKQTIQRNQIKIIAKHTLYRFGHIVLLDDFRELELEIPFVRELLSGKPGTMMSHICFMQNSIWANQNGYNPSISYTFDRGDEFWGELYSQYKFADKVLNKEPELLGDGFKNVSSLTSANKVLYSGIQAADLIAWECRNYVMNQKPIDRKSSLASARRPRYEMTLLGERNNNFTVWGKQALKNEILNKFGFLLNTMNQDEAVKILVGEGKPFNDFDELLKISLKIRKEEETKQHKARQEESTLKRKRLNEKEN